MGEGGLRSLPPTQDERPAARPPSPLLPRRGLGLLAAPLMSQAPWRAARGLRECGCGREGRVRRAAAAGVAGGGGAPLWALGAALAPSRPRREVPKFGDEDAGFPRRLPFSTAGPAALMVYLG